MLNMETVRRQSGDFMVKLVCGLSLAFMEKTWQIKLPECLIWRLYGGSVEFMVKLVCRLSLVFMEKTWQIKLPDNLHTDFIIKPSFKKHSP